MNKINLNMFNSIKWKIKDWRDYRYEWEADTYTSNLSIDGLNLKYNTRTWKTIYEKNIYAPTLKRFFNSVKNIITSNEYKWLLKDTWVSEDFTEQHKLAAQAVLDYVYKINKFNVLDDIIVSNILKYFFAMVYVDYNNNSKKKVDLKIIHPFHIYIEPWTKTTSWIFDWQYIVFLEETTKTEVQNNTWINNVDEAFIDYYEWIDYLDSFIDWENKKYHYCYYFYKKNWKIFWYKLFGRYIVKEYRDLEMYPISIIKAQEEDYNLYGTSLSTLIAPVWEKLQETYDILAKHIRWYWKRLIFQKKWGLLAARWLNEAIAEKTNIDWILEFTWDVPQTYQPPQLDNSFTYIQSILDNVIQNSVWVHTASLWAVEGRSWVQMAQAQQSDKQNIIDIVQNYKEWIEWLAKIILYLFSEKLDMDMILDYEWIKLRVIWNKEYQTLKDLWVNVSTLIPIKYFERLDVEIVPWDFFTQTYITNKLIELKSMWLPIPDEVLMNSIKVWDIGLLLRKYDLFNTQKQEENPDIDIAKSENKKMSWWQRVEASTTDNHQLHLAVHYQYLNDIQNMITQQFIQQVWTDKLSKEQQAQLQNIIWNNEIVKNVLQHIEEHKTFIDWQQNIQAQKNLLNNL